MDLASHLGLPLTATMRSTTSTQFLLWKAYLDAQWERPSRSDWYQMQTAMEVKRVLSKQPGRVKLRHFKLGFDNKRGRAKLDPETQVQQSKNYWLGLTGVKTDGTGGT
jgi:hypothetical protein